MKILSTVILLLTVISVYAQERVTGIDSLVQVPADTLQVAHARLHSLQNTFIVKADSIRTLQQETLGKLAARKAGLTQSIDSLQSLNFPADKYLQKKDSVEQEIARTQQQYELKIAALKSTYSAKVEKLKLPSKASAQVDKVTKAIEGFELPPTDIPALDVPELNLPDVKVPDVNLDGITSNDLNIPDTNLQSTDALSGTQQQIRDVVPGTGQLADIKEVTAVKDLDGAGKLAEEKVSGLDGVKDITGQSGELDNLNALASEDAAKDMVTQQATEQLPQQAINHFAGKEQVLQKAMEDLSKLKNKYSSLSSLSEIPKKRPNEMRGKPFIERIRPGLGMQFFGGNNSIMVDFNPYAGYRLTGRLTSGLGWNQRVAFNTKDYRFICGSAVYGPRIYTEYNLWRGFHPRLEIEVVRTTIPPVLLPSTTDVQDRQWVWGMMFGLKKQYKIANGVNGTAMAMFKLFDRHHKSPYKDVVNMRVGVELILKKKVKP